jgi:hypothetical protein
MLHKRGGIGKGGRHGKGGWFCGGRGGQRRDHVGLG